MVNKPIASDFLEYDETTNTYRRSAEQNVRDDIEKHHWLNVGRTILKDWRLYLMLVPMILVFLFWRYFPMYELISAFKDSSKGLDDVITKPFLGFANFKTLLVSSNPISQQFWRAFRNTFLLSFYGLCFGFPMPIIIALFFNEIKSNAVRSVFQVLTYLPKFMSTVIITTLVTLLLQPSSNLVGGGDMGVISKILVWMGMDRSVGEAGLLNTPLYFRAIYQISGIWETAGYDSIIFFAAIIAVSPTSYEAAQIDGAGKMAQMRYVVLPSILSTIVIMLITRIGSLLNIGYEKVYLLRVDGIVETGKCNVETAEVVSTFAIANGMEGSLSSLKSLSAAAEMMNNIIGMLLVIGANTIARKASDVSLY